MLYTDLPPITPEQGQKTIPLCFEEQLSDADCVDLLVGSVSVASVDKLGELISTHPNIRFVRLIVSMSMDKMVQETRHAVCELNEQWRKDRKGEVLVTKDIEYSVGCFCFSRNQRLLSCIMGAAQLDAILPPDKNNPQYYVATLIDDPEAARIMASQVDEVIESHCIGLRDINGLGITSLQHENSSHIEAIISSPAR